MGRESGDSDCIEIGKGSEWSRTVMVRSGPQWLRLFPQTLLFLDSPQFISLFLYCETFQTALFLESSTTFLRMQSPNARELRVHS